MAAWAAAGVALPHLTVAQAHAAPRSPTNLSQAVGGDLVFIPGSDGTAANPGHVGMVAGYVDGTDGRHLYLIQAADDRRAGRADRGDRMVRPDRRRSAHRMNTNKHGGDTPSEHEPRRHWP